MFGPRDSTVPEVVPASAAAFGAHRFHERAGFEKRLDGFKIEL